MSFSYETDYLQNEILAKSSNHLKTMGYQVEPKGFLLKAINGRDYTTWVLVLLIVACILVTLFLIIIFWIVWIVVPIYWFTRKKNVITVDASSKGKFTITYEGEKAFEEALRLSNMFRRFEAHQIVQRCPNCGAEIQEGSSYCTNCGYKLY